MSAARESQFGRVPEKSIESRGLSNKLSSSTSWERWSDTGYNLYTTVIAEIPIGSVPEIGIPSSPTTKVSKLKLNERIILLSFSFVMELSREIESGMAPLMRHPYRYLTIEIHA